MFNATLIVHDHDEILPDIKVTYFLLLFMSGSIFKNQLSIQILFQLKPDFLSKVSRSIFS